MSVIGIVRLAPGQVGYFDDLTRIHLTIASPEKPVVSGMNTNNLKRAVKSGRILLVNGSLDVVTKAPVQEPVQTQVAPTPAVEVKTEVPVQEPAETEIKEESGVVILDTEAALQKIQEEKETTVEEQPAVEETTEEVAVETVEEAAVVAEEATEDTVETEEVVETATEEATETEVKVAAKKTNSNKKK
jgi:hypothetical protein